MGGWVGVRVIVRLPRLCFGVLLLVRRRGCSASNHARFSCSSCARFIQFQYAVQPVLVQNVFVREHDRTARVTAASTTLLYSYKR